MREPLAQDYSIVWHNPDDRFYVEGCGLVHLGGEVLLAVVPVVPRHTDPLREQRASVSRIHLVRSEDGGRTWHKVAELPHYSAVPFVHAGAVYLFANNGGTKYRNDDLLLRRSDDGGRSWTPPVTLFSGHYWNCHTGMVIQDQRLYWAVDDLSFGMSGVGSRGPLVVVGDLTRDLLEPAAWRKSNPVPFPGVPAPFWQQYHEGQPGANYLEPNVISVAGRLRVLATVKIGGQSTAGFGAVLDLADDGQRLDLRFAQYHPMPGGQLKFCVIRDEASGLFWATVNLPVDSQGAFGWEQNPLTYGPAPKGERGGNDRRFLMLQYGMDGLNWFPAGCIARTARLAQSFMYARPVVLGDDLGIISRTSIHAPNRHDADHATFHRVRHFRSLAMDLRPAGLV